MDYRDENNNSRDNPVTIFDTISLDFYISV